jgi:cysteine desulfurase/selenocysteine lyase
MTLARTHALPRVVLSRSVRAEDYGALLYEKSQLEQAVVVLNTMSNIDGQQLRNLKKLASDVHEMNGILILDVCQTLAHDERFLHRIDADVLVGSGHKMNAPSLGFTIIKKQLLRECDLMFVGGGMVSAVEKEAYTLLSSDDDLSALLEPGLQNYAGIAGLYAALLWLRDWRYTKNGKTYTRHEYEAFLAQHFADGLSTIPAYMRTNVQPSPIVALSHKTTDAHQLATYLAAQGIMVRSGHFCCHYYCGSVRKFPPLLRVSIGLHTQVEDLDHILHTLSRLA